MQLAVFYNSHKPFSLPDALPENIRKACLLLSFSPALLLSVPSTVSHICFVLNALELERDQLLYCKGYADGASLPFIVLVSGPGSQKPVLDLLHPSVSFPILIFFSAAELSAWIEKEYLSTLAGDIQDAARDSLLARGISCVEEGFFAAVAGGDTEIVDLFLTAGFSASLSDQKGIPVLSLAVRAQFPKVVLQLLEAGADVDRQSLDRGYSALMDAVQKGDLAIAEMLLSRGASVNLRSKDGQTALIISSGRGDLESAALLVRYGADPLSTDALGMSAVSYARLFHNDKLLELFNNCPA